MEGLVSFTAGKAHSPTLTWLLLPILPLLHPQLKTSLSSLLKDAVSSLALAITRFSIICRCRDRV